MWKWYQYKVLILGCILLKYNGVPDWNMSYVRMLEVCPNTDRTSHSLHTVHQNLWTLVTHNSISLLHLYLVLLICIVLVLSPPQNAVLIVYVKCVGYKVKVLQYLYFHNCWLWHFRTITYRMCRCVCDVWLYQIVSLNNDLVTAIELRSWK